MEDQNKETMQKIWNFGNIPVKIISSTFKIESHGRFSFATSAGETSALWKLCSFLRSVNPSLDVSSQLSVGVKTHDELVQNHLMLIGGPAQNQITREILKKFREKETKLKWDFNEQFQLVNRQIREEKYYYQKFDDYFVDYAILLKDSNPFNDDRLVFIIAGYSAGGTDAAVEFCTNNEVMKAIVRKYHDGPFMFLMKIDSRDSVRPDDPFVTLVDSKELEFAGLPILLDPIVYEAPIMDTRNLPNIPITKYFLWLSLGIISFVISLFYLSNQIFYFIPGLFASMAMLFSLPLWLWKKHKLVFGVSPHFSLFGFWMSAAALSMSLVAVVLQIVFK